MWSKTPNFILPLRPGWYFKSEKRAPPEAEPKGWVVQNPVQPETGPAVLDPIPSKGMLITLDSASVHSRPNPAFPVTVPFGAWAKSAEPRTIRMPSPLPGRVAGDLIHRDQGGRAEDDVNSVYRVGADHVACPDIKVVDADSGAAAVEDAYPHPAAVADLRIDHGGARAVDCYPVARVVDDRAA